MLFFSKYLFACGQSLLRTDEAPNSQLELPTGIRKAHSVVPKHYYPEKHSECSWHLVEDYQAYLGTSRCHCDTRGRH